MAGCLLLDISSFFLILRDGMEQEESFCSFVTSISGWILCSLG